MKRAVKIARCDRLSIVFQETLCNDLESPIASMGECFLCAWTSTSSKGYVVVAVVAVVVHRTQSKDLWEAVRQTLLPIEL
jgi:hypothetical protein